MNGIEAKQFPSKSWGLNMGSGFSLAVALAAFSGGGAQALAASQPVLGCDGASMQQVVGSTATITAVQNLTTATAGLSYCRVDGFVTTSGPAPTTNQVRFMVSMPQRLENRYYFQGLGGSAGYIPPPAENLLVAGFAFATTDAGSPTPGVNWIFALDRTKAEDWDKRGGHVSARVTQQLVRAYYGLSDPAGKGFSSERLYRYHSGCSGGGRMGIVAASWYPDDFDGVVAGAPGLHAANTVFFGKLAQRVLANPQAWVSPAALLQLEEQVVARFDGADGVVDGVVSRPDQVVLDGDLLAPFTEAQQETLRMVTEGLTSPGAIYPGLSVANPIGWSAFLLGTSAPPWSLNPADGRLPPAGYIVFDTTSRGIFGLGYDFTTQLDFDNPADLAGWLQMYAQVYPGSGTIDARDLRQFVGKGGKILFWHGMADNAISLFDTEQFVQQITHGASIPGGANAAVLYPVPGIQHCGGGFGPQDVPDRALEALTRWVEGGQRPHELVGLGTTPTGSPARSYLLCPHPQKARLIGRGRDVNDAANWRCSN